ncbi:helix-turn-helix domain-containing protein [Rhizobium lemnae]
MACSYTTENRRTRQGPGVLLSSTADTNSTRVSSNVHNLALVPPALANRETTYASGFTDFIAWPLTPSELSVRILGRCGIWSDEGKYHRFSPIPLVERICNFMSEDPQRTVSVRSLARNFHSNHNTINRLFKQEFGLPPLAWQRKLRLEGAAYRLMRSMDSINEIAAEFGYPSPNNFATAFKRRFGKSPLQYRRDEARKRQDD